jgi:hypothetical protein
MSMDLDTRRTLDVALADLYDKFDRTPEKSGDTRRALDRMTRDLEAEIVERCSLALPRYDWL